MCCSLNTRLNLSRLDGKGICNIKLHSSNRLKLKSQFTRLTKVQKSPYYRGLELWDKLPEKLQNEPSKLKFKGEIKKYKFNDELYESYNCCQ